MTTITQLPTHPKLIAALGHYYNQITKKDELLLSHSDTLNSVIHQIKHHKHLYVPT